MAFHLASRLSDISSRVNVTDPPKSSIPAVMVLLTTCLETLRSVENSSMVAFNRTEARRNNDDRSIADALAKEVRLLCWVMTCPVNHVKKARHVKATWGKRCNKLLFMSTEEDSLLPTIKLPVYEGRKYLWGKTKNAFKYIYKNHWNDADWFLKADDDTYVVVENLRYLLSKYNTSHTTFFGRRIGSVSQGYMNGGAGYVLSKATLSLFVTKGLTSPKCKRRDRGSEDVSMGRCLHRLGVKFVDTYDNFGNSFFFHRGPQYYLKEKNSTGGCSDHVISFHYVDAKIMYLYDFFVYQLRPYGIRYSMNVKVARNNETLPTDALGENTAMMIHSTVGPTVN